MNSVFFLSKYIFCSFANEWISLTDLCLIDTAVTNKLHRSLFLRNIQLCNGCIKSHMSENSLPFISWLLLRKLIFYHMGLNGFIFVEQSNNRNNNKSVISTTINYFYKAFNNVYNKSNSNQYNINLRSVVELIRRSELSKVKYLDFSKNLEISGSQIVSVFGACMKVQHINLHKCKFLCDNDVVQLAKVCSKLLEINLSNCVGIIDNGVCVLIESNTQLTNVNLSNCTQITNRTLVCLAMHCASTLMNVDFSLTSAYKSNSVQLLCNIDFITFVTACNQVIQFSANNQPGVDIEVITALIRNNVHLQRLDLLNCVVDVTEFQCLIPKLCNLTELTLMKLSQSIDLLTPYYDTFFESLTLTCVKLVRITSNHNCLSNNQITSVGTHCTALVTLQLSCKGSKSDIASGFVLLSTQCTRLTELNLLDCVAISDATLETTLVNCRLITALKIPYAIRNYFSNALTSELFSEGRSDCTLDIIALHCNLRITNLQLSGLNNLPYSTYCHFVDNCRNITKLDLGSTRELHDDFVVAMAYNFTQLRSLTLSSSVFITDASIKTFCEVRCKTLTSLRLIGTMEHITSKSIEYIAYHLYKLQKFSLTVIDNRCVMNNAVLLLLVTKCLCIRKLTIFDQDITPGEIRKLVNKYCKYVTDLNV